MGICTEITYTCVRYSKRFLLLGNDETPLLGERIMRWELGYCNRTVVMIEVVDGSFCPACKSTSNINALVSQPTPNIFRTMLYACLNIRQEMERRSRCAYPSDIPWFIL